ncbi:TPA: hypothetical protein PPS74_005189, partial [Salmonella enterica subsp. enterica serovar Concord]|nr:hypothetical protein [Salmonella enterica subsp. enterica serovar Concord]
SDVSLTHSQALEIIAKNSNFSNYHELTKVSKETPLESRLLMAAFGDNNFEEAIYHNGPFLSLEMAVDDELAADIATTNAEGFVIDDLTVLDTAYDETKGILDMQVAFNYLGDQLPDHVYSGTEFDVEAKVRLSWRDEKWNFIDEDFEITRIESDT